MPAGSTSYLGLFHRGFWSSSRTLDGRAFPFDEHCEEVPGGARRTPGAGWRHNWAPSGQGDATLGAALQWRRIPGAGVGRDDRGRLHDHRGARSLRHVHANEDELFYVLAGEHVFFVGDEEFRLGPDGLCFEPRGVPHAHRRVVPRAGAS
ncbi:MAG: cupin domain-containing protein [Thermoleophilia bacterium]